VNCIALAQKNPRCQRINSEFHPPSQSKRIILSHCNELPNQPLISPGRVNARAHVDRAARVALHDRGQFRTHFGSTPDRFIWEGVGVELYTLQHLIRTNCPFRLVGYEYQPAAKASTAPQVLALQGGDKVVRSERVLAYCYKVGDSGNTRAWPTNAERGIPRGSSPWEIAKRVSPATS